MKVTELSRDQIIELKQTLLTDRNNAQGKGISYGELAEADTLVSDEEVFEGYAGVDFTDDDFKFKGDDTVIVYGCSMEDRPLIDRSLETELKGDVTVIVHGVIHTVPAKVADAVVAKRAKCEAMCQALTELVEHAVSEDPFSVDMTEYEMTFEEYVGKPYAELTENDLMRIVDLFHNYHDGDRLEETAWDLAIRQFIGDIKEKEHDALPSK